MKHEERITVVDILNPVDGYQLSKLRDEPRRFLWIIPLQPRTIFKFQLNLEHPLTIVLSDGMRIQPDRHVAETDGGSIPPLFRIFWTTTRWLLSFLFHDSGYLHHGLYFAGPDDTEFVFVKMPREAVDHLLYECIVYEGGGPSQRYPIFTAVSLFGQESWDKGPSFRPILPILTKAP